MKIKKPVYFFLLAIKGFIYSCDNKQEKTQIITKNYNIQIYGNMPSVIDESSGLEKIKEDKNKFYTHNDGNDNTLYKISLRGKILSKNALNIDIKDWEDITSDSSGNIYIGDFGNNFNKRKDLRIFKYNINAGKYSIIHFFYQDQKKYPPESNILNFDCEAMFYFKDSLYLFSKNRGLKIVKCYTLPANKGTYKAKINSRKFIKSPVTAADISPDKSKFILLTYRYVYIFKIIDHKITLNAPTSCLSLAKCGQAEGISFINNHDFVISNENRKLFLAKRKRHNQNNE